VQPGEKRGLAAAAAGVFLLVALSFLPVARLLRYATVGVSGRGKALLLVVPVSLAATLLYERIVRGALYGVLGRRLPVGAAAPVVAFLGALLPAALRLGLLPGGTAPFTALALQALLVELGLGLGLCLLALGTGSTAPGGVALGLLWVSRFSVAVSFRGGVVPALELAAAWLAPLATAAVLTRPLTPWRRELFG
jgi:hypothetical protein